MGKTLNEEIFGTENCLKRKLKIRLGENTSQGRFWEGIREVTNIRNEKFSDQNTENSSQGKYASRKICENNQGSDNSEVKNSTNGSSMKIRTTLQKKTRKEKQRKNIQQKHTSRRSSQ